MNSRYVHRRGNVWHFRMPLSKQYQRFTIRKELNISLQTTEYKQARAKAAFLEYKILKELLPMLETIRHDEIDKTIRAFLKKCLLLYDEIARNDEVKVVDKIESSAAALIAQKYPDKTSFSTAITGYGMPIKTSDYASESKSYVEADDFKNEELSLLSQQINDIKIDLEPVLDLLHN